MKVVFILNNIIQCWLIAMFLQSIFEVGMYFYLEDYKNVVESSIFVIIYMWILNYFGIGNIKDD